MPNLPSWLLTRTALAVVAIAAFVGGGAVVVNLAQETTLVIALAPRDVTAPSLI